WPAGLEATRLTLGENKTNVPWDIVRAKLIILWGKNSAETNIHQMPFIEGALQNGAELVVIDPRRTESAERASLFVQPRPGTDGALALAIAHLLVKNDWIDHSFISKNVYGFDRFREHLTRYDPAQAADVTGIPLQNISRLAELIGTRQPVTINAGFGMQRYSNSGQTIRAILSLLAITGNIGKPGAGWIFADLQTQIFDAVKDPFAFYPPSKTDGIVRQSISTALLGKDILEQKDPPIKMIWVERGNPVTQNPESHTVLTAFRSVDFRVVVDQFMTDTAREADLVLPAKTMFEQTDVIGAYWHPYIQLKQKVIEPPGGVKPESEIYYLLAGYLGFSDEEIRDYLPGPSEQEIENFLKNKLAPFPGLTLDTLKATPCLAPGVREIAFSDLVFSTPSAKIELYSEEARDRWQSDPLPTFKLPVEALPPSAQKTGSYPLYFMTPNTKNRIHSQFNNLKSIRQFSEKPTLSIHPHDANPRNINDGDTVKVYNDRGAIEVEAQIDYGILPGCVSVTNGWWITEGGTVNFLSGARETDMGFGAAFHENMVEVKRIVQ
ncbi:MAG: hypothetical protein E4H13_02685, partial [Calditrichales bacterium]